MEAQCLYRFVQGVNDSFSPHRHEFYEIFITVSGTVRHRINGHTIPLPEGSLVFIRPDDDHGYLYDGKKSDETAYINLTFTTETALQLFEYLSDGFPSKRLNNSHAADSHSYGKRKKAAYRANRRIECR